MDLKPLKVSGMQFTTNNTKQPVTDTRQAKQTVYYISSFNDLLEGLMMEQQEQM